MDEVGLAWQFAAENPTVLAAEFSELAAQLGVQDVVGTRDPVAWVHNVLASFSVGWLLVFDNAPDLASVERFLPPAGPGRILITSQNPNWPHGQPLAVPVLETEVAADFLITRTGDPGRLAARELASELDGLPLALAQAAAYILAIGGTLARYLALLKERRADMLSRGEPTGYSGTVATTWSLAFARLEQSAPSVVGLPDHADTLADARASPGRLARQEIRPGPATSSPRCCPSLSGFSDRNTPHPELPHRSRPLDRRHEGRGRGARPILSPAARV